MTDYTIHYKKTVAPSDLSRFQWDTVISAYNGSERVQRVFNLLHATRKHWIIQREYGFRPDELPTNGQVFEVSSDDEAEALTTYLNEADLSPADGTLCIDITGFMRPHVMFLIQLLGRKGFLRFDVLYSEPNMYSDSGKTIFSDGPVREIRQVAGFEGTHLPGNEFEDLLVIGAGFDDRLVRMIADSKKHAKKRLMFGFPPLKADMYQQGRSRMAMASEQIGVLSQSDVLFAPANDPFVTAQVLSEAMSFEAKKLGTAPNVYLSPLGTKAQALGFALYYLYECAGSPTSIIFPFSARYTRETSLGLSRVSVFSIQLPSPAPSNILSR